MNPRALRQMAIVIILVGFASAGFSVAAAVPAARPSAMVSLAIGAVFGVVALRRAIRGTGSPKAILALALVAAAAYAVTTVLAFDILCLHGLRLPDGSCAWE